LKISVLITVFNRIDTTLAGLESLFASIAAQREAEFDVYVTDDASPDGTAAAIRAQFPQVHVIDGTGNLWWVRGMDLAYQASKKSGHKYDAYLLYNDDVALAPAAMGQLVAAFRTLNNEAPTALYGPMCTTEGRSSYPGRSINPKHRAHKPFHPRLLMETPPNGTFRACDTFHANCLLVPAHLYEALGGMDPVFHHRHGDTDLGFRLAKSGCRNMVMPDYVGRCELNAPFAVAETFMGRVRQALYPPNPLSDELHLVFRHYAFPSAIANACVRIAYLARDVLFPGKRRRAVAQWHAAQNSAGSGQARA
jgi:GT2 family glycosyltransferase